MANNVVPQNCANPPYSFYFIPNSQSQMISLLYMRVATGQLQMGAYTDPTSGGYCAVNQLVVGPIP